MGEDISQGNMGRRAKPSGTHGHHAAYNTSCATHSAKPPDLERDQLFPLAEERSHGGNGLQPKTRKRGERKRVKRKDLDGDSPGGSGREGLTVSPEHPVLHFVRHGDTCGLHFLHKGLVQSGRRHGAAGQDGLRRNREHTGDDARRRRRDGRENEFALAHRRRGFMLQAGAECALEPVLQPGDYHPTESIPAREGHEPADTISRGPCRWGFSPQIAKLLLVGRKNTQNFFFFKKVLVWRCCSCRGAVTAQFARPRIIGLLARLGSNREGGTVESLCLI